MKRISLAGFLRLISAAITLSFIMFSPPSGFANTIYFPQVAVGGGYSTTFVIMNMGTASVSAPFNVYSQSGILQPAYGRQISIPPGGSTRFTLPNAGPLTVVWAALAAGLQTVQGVATFDLRADNGALITTAGVLGLEAGNGFLLPVDVTTTASTGVAIANATTSAVNVRLRLLAENGSAVGTSNDARLNPLGSNSQVADFVTSMFPQLTGTTFRGTLVVEAAAGTPTNSLAATALTVKEGLLSALPVIPTTSSGGSTGGSSGTASVNFTLLFLGGGTVQFQSRTIIIGDLRNNTFDNLAPGTYEMTGTLGQGLTIRFTRGFLSDLGPGGVVPGSLRNLSEPTAVIDACQAIYVNTGTPLASFRLQFQVTSSTPEACP